MQGKYIGNIITTYSKDKFPSFFNVRRDYSDALDGIPTIIIGFAEAKHCIDGFSILIKSYDNKNLWWTYRKTERKYEYDEDIQAFYHYCFDRFLKNVRYFYLNLPSYSMNDYRRIYKWIKSSNRKLCFLTRASNFLFIYDTVMNIVFGLSLTLCEYMGTQKRKVVALVKSNKANVFVYDTSFIDGDVRTIIANNTHYILPLAEVLSID